jgi:hypothetical protein
MAKHNKKRNVGLIHEQLVRYVASSLIAKDKKSAGGAVKIITKHFKPGTELYREFRLFNALINLPVGSKSLAERILTESKKSAATHDPQKLRREKSILIKDINTQLSESRRFYDIKIPNYRLFATVQTILNEWRGKNKLDLTVRAKYEEQIVEWLARSEEPEIIKENEADPLVRQLMFQKFEKKYRDALSDRQKVVLEVSILSGPKEFVEIVRETKTQSLESIKKFKRTCDNKILMEKINDVCHRVESLQEVKSDDVIAKTLHLVHLIEEMEDKDE